MLNIIVLLMNEEEKKVVSIMISIYCNSKHGTRKVLCEECNKLNSYAHGRLERCPFGEYKPTCGSCTVHCYKKDMRGMIKEVMKMAGPRMLFLHPIITIKHFYRENQRNRLNKSKTPEGESN